MAFQKSVKFESGHHWYQCRGGAPTPEHDADLRIARKKFLYPSITTILKDEFNNEFLAKWKTNELLIAAANNYRQPHENDEQYCQRIYDISLNKSITAANFGKKIHHAIENYPRPSTDPELQPWLSRFAQWYEANVECPLSREGILLDHDLGLAGTCDFIGRGRGQFAGQIIVPDWKTQNVKKDDKGRKKPVFYESWPRQLSFYSVAEAKRANNLSLIPTCISAIIDSNEPDDLFVRVWTKEEILSAYEDVVIAAYRWFKKRGYYPHPKGMFKIGFNLDMPT